MAGAPKGNNNRARACRLQHEFDKVIRRRSASDELESLQKMIEAQVIAAEAGDLAAFREVMDRRFGKPIQGLEHAGPDGGEIIIQISPSEANL